MPAIEEGRPGSAAGLRATLLVLALAAVGGLAGEASGMPAGALLGALGAVSAYNLWTDGAARLPPIVRDASRALVGTAIGSLATPALLVAIGVHLPWAILFTFLVVLIGLASGWLLARLSKVDLPTALLSCSPGGMPEMSALSEDLGARTDIVVGIHVVRKIAALIAVSALVLLLGET